MSQKEKGHSTVSLTITRMFDAPRERIWRAWTEPEILKKWWGPRTWTTPVAKIDLRIGGKYQSCMRSPEGKDTCGIGTIKELVKPERLVMTDSFADAEGNIVSASTYGMPGNWPLELLIAVRLEEQGGKTKLTLQHDGFPDDQNAGMAKAGWTESFDKLDEYLKTGTVSVKKA